MTEIDVLRRKVHVLELRLSLLEQTMECTHNTLASKMTVDPHSWEVNYSCILPSYGYEKHVLQQVVPEVFVPFYELLSEEQMEYQKRQRLVKLVMPDEEESNEP